MNIAMIILDTMIHCIILQCPTMKKFDLKLLNYRIQFSSNLELLRSEYKTRKKSFGKNPNLVKKTGALHLMFLLKKN